MAHQPIENHGLIGDLHTVALVGIDGSIEWFCAPRFDSPSVFGRLIDHDKGGFFSVSPTEADAVCKQYYWPETNVLITRFLAPHGSAELADFMPVDPETERDDDRPGGARGTRRRIVRRLTAQRGRLRVRMHCRPAFDYARAPHAVERRPGGVLFRSPDLALALAADVPVEEDGAGGVAADVTVEEGASVVFVLREEPDPDACTTCETPEDTEALFRETVAWWRRWVAGCTYTGRWRETVHRSALALKLLTYAPTGAIVASPTCSLPEEIGGTRNWDYRYTWIRDAAFTIYALLRLGFTSEAGAFMDFLERLCTAEHDGRPLQIMYGIDGRRTLTEETLDHLAGHRGSRPVRTGNGAHDQLQLDIYGELIDAIYIFNKRGAPISYDLWLSVRRFVDWVCDNWRTPDEGVWEVRSGRRHFVYSKVMCWVAVDRGLRLAEKRSFPHDRIRWLACRDAIYEDVMARGWDPERRAFVQAYGDHTLDAANLIMPLVFFMAPTDPRMLDTLKAVLEPPHRGGLVSDSLVYRYNMADSADGLSGEEGTFNICTFWLVEALTRAGRFDRGCLEDARIIFERMLGFANHVGLYAEETGPSGEALGNYPQAFTHLALISAAVNLDAALG